MTTIKKDGISREISEKELQSWKEKGWSEVKVKKVAEKVEKEPKKTEEQPEEPEKKEGE